MSISKQYLKNKPVCKVTFTFPKENGANAKEIYLAGEFNNWDIKATPMIKAKNGTFSTKINLETGREYQFRYLLDGNHWENDEKADKYVPNSFGDADNGVIIL